MTIFQHRDTRDLMTSRVAKGASTHGVGHDGRPKGAVPVMAGMHTPITGPGHAVPGNPARDGAPKVHHNVGVHDGMVSRDRAGTEYTAITQTQVANAPDASGRSPLGPTIEGKRLSPVAAHPFMRSRINADCETFDDKKGHGDCMLRDAIISGSSKLRGE
jgi:hypothetical protein